VTDKIFTRIGASDNLARGESTFMVEMIETAHILNNMSEKSLVILDEIGRGTSTFDGISIAWAVCEYLGRNDGPRPKTLFATHYHELTGLEKMMTGVKSYTVLVKDYQDEVVFLRTIVPGSADRSYGIHVGKLAGLPEEVVRRAERILAELEDGSEAGELKLRRGKIVGSEGREHGAVIPLLDRSREIPGNEPAPELPLFRAARAEHPLLTEIKELDIQNMTPLEALNRLNELKEKAKTPLPRVHPSWVHHHS
jgi:DNA mismatch repair protein MutS